MLVWNMNQIDANRREWNLQLLEQVDQDVQQKNPYIKTPVKLEQSLIEGAYHKVTTIFWNDFVSNPEWTELAVAWVLLHLLDETSFIYQTWL